MNQIHTDDVDLFANTLVNTAEVKKAWIEHRPVYMEKAGTSNVQFHIPGNATEYIDLGKSLLYIQLRIVKEDGTEFAKSDDGKVVEFATPVNGILDSMWSGIDVYFNGVLVSTSGTNYTYKAFIENLLNYSKEATKNQLSSIGMTVDDANFDSTFPLDSTDQSGTITGVNSGLRERNKLFVNGVGEFQGVILSDICNQGKLILNSVDIDITFTPNKDEFRLITSPNGLKCKILIEDMSISVCKVTVNPGVLIGHANMLKTHNAKYPFQRTEIRTYAVPAMNMSDTIEDIYKSIIPSKLVVGFVDQAAYHGEFSSNPLKFDHFDISSICLYVDGVSTPTNPMKLDIENGIYLEAITSIYRTVGKLFENTDIPIDRKTWAAGLAFFAFDLDPTAPADLRFIGTPKFGHTRLNFTFKNKLQRSITAIMYAVFPSRVEIDEARNVRIVESRELLQELVKQP